MFFYFSIVKEICSMKFENEHTLKFMKRNEEKEFHSRYERAVRKIKRQFGRKYPMIIHGKNVISSRFFVHTSPIDTRITLGYFPSGNAAHAQSAILAAKKSFEKGVEINGVMYYKKSEPHKASVTGDTVGDPFKDTSGPSMNILIKLMSIVSLVIAPTLAQMSGPKEAHAQIKKETPPVKTIKDEKATVAVNNTVQYK